MPSSKSTTAAGSAGRGSIDEAIDKNKQVAEEVKAAADELAVVHAVLDKKLPHGAREEDVVQAVAQTNVLEKRLDESSKVLDEVNEQLEREARARSSPGR